MNPKVLLVDEDPDRAAALRAALAGAGYDVAAAFASARDLYTQVLEHAPDLIIIDTESPTRDVLEHIALISRDQPRPIVMFSSDRASETIRATIRAGVSAYVVDGFGEERVEPILKVAVERFEAGQALKRELADTQSQLAEKSAELAERKLVERAKGVLMKQKSIDEEEAFRSLRKFAMDRGIRLADAAEQVMQVAKLFG